VGIENIHIVVRRKEISIGETNESFARWASEREEGFVAVCCGLNRRVNDERTPDVRGRDLDDTGSRRLNLVLEIFTFFLLYVTSII
jgi:hypothetical protein